MQLLFIRQSTRGAAYKLRQNSTYSVKFSKVFTEKTELWGVRQQLSLIPFFIEITLKFKSNPSFLLH
jgi:hypothetical protein